VSVRSGVGARSYEGESGFVGRGTDPTPARVEALDGIRAVAILMVLVHNVGSVVGNADGAAMKMWALASNGGWIGVQLFFALSGFLITGILLGSAGGPHWLRSFYARRLLRIVPLYFAVLAVVFFVAPHVSALHAIAPPPARSTLWYWTYLSNWVAPFGGMALALPHVWSLAVEEQFYLFWPAVIARAGDRALAWACALLVVLPLLVRVVLHRVWDFELASNAAYTWTVTRTDAIAFGALVAIGMRYTSIAQMLGRRAVVALLATCAALGVVTVLGRGLSPQGPLSELAAQPLSGILGAILVAVCVGPAAAGEGLPALRRGLVAFLASAPMRTIGKYSYAIYVFHMPIRFLLRDSFTPRLTDGSPLARLGAHVVFTLVVLALSFVAALVSWRVLEAPLLSLKRYFPMPAGTRRALGPT
jgi:peptidoglycan/LPS O-acetylase OafA/YrhL